MVVSVELIHRVKIADQLILQLEYDIMNKQTWVSILYYDKIVLQLPIEDATAKLKEIIREIDKFKTVCELVKL